MKKIMKQLSSVTIVLAVALGCSGCQSEPEKYPNGNINVVVSASAGGDTDTYARILSQYMEDELGVTLSIVNKGSAIEGTREVHNAENDGYTVEFFHASSLLTQIVGKTDIGALDQTVCTIPVIDTTQTLVIPANKYKDIDDFVQQALSGKEIIASVNQGSYAHLACALFEDAIGAKFKYVDSQNAAERITDMLAGRIDIFFAPYGTISQYVESGDFISLGIMSDERNPFLPDVPTFKEQGYDITMDKYFYFAFPPNTDPAIVNTFAQAVEKATAKKECIDAFAGYYIVPEYYSPEKSVELLKEAQSSYAQYKDVLSGE
ncbi:MAG: Bug family tripartite tricarboxylate transporter substrate binding protein [Lachnospiraceae bacterium]|jgi:tripartite-type tricarboxylate transporter receptor subunit TctC